MWDQCRGETQWPHIPTKGTTPVPLKHVRMAGGSTLDLSPHAPLVRLGTALGWSLVCDVRARMRRTPAVPELVKFEDVCLMDQALLPGNPIL